MEYSKSREIKGKRYYRRGWEMEKEENETGSKIEKNTKERWEKRWARQKEWESMKIKEMEK
jgi:hypothetical protein